MAATRAQKNLYLLNPQLEAPSWGRFEAQGYGFSEPSRFITEIANFEELSDSWALEIDKDDPF